MLVLAILGLRPRDMVLREGGEIGEGMADGGELPVEHGDHPGLGRVQYHVVQTKIAVHDADRIVARDIAGNPRLFNMSADIGAYEFMP